MKLAHFFLVSVFATLFGCTATISRPIEADGVQFPDYKSWQQNTIKLGKAKMDSENVYVTRYQSDNKRGEVVEEYSHYSGLPWEIIWFENTEHDGWGNLIRIIKRRYFRSGDTYVQAGGREYTVLGQE